MPRGDDIRIRFGRRLEPLDTTADIIAANLPYVPTAVCEKLPPEIREHEPREALDGGPDGLRLIERLLRQAPRYLKAGGALFAEIGDEQGQSARALAAAFPQARIEVRESRDPRNRRLLSRLTEAADGNGRFLVTALPPDPVFPASLRAMDLNLYWPDAPTQSGRMARAAGVGATVIGRDIEGIGNMLREMGAPACADFNEPVHWALAMLRDPELAASIHASCRRYALAHSWAVQARRHLEFADALVVERERAIAAGHS